MTADMSLYRAAVEEFAVVPKSSAPLDPQPQPLMTAPSPKRVVPASCVPLTQALAASAASGNGLGVVFATFANSAQADFALNWIAHLERLGLERSALLGATDAEAERTLGAAGTRCFALASRIGGEEAKWGSPGFAQMGRTKADFVRRFLAFNVTLFFADADVVFLRDPLDYVGAALARGAQLLFHTDAFRASPEVLAADPASFATESPTFVRGAELNTGMPGGPSS